jgi:hypothetical protein
MLLLKKKSKNFKLFTNLYLTFHLGQDKAWGKNISELGNKNIENSKSIVI